jgi:hypothetical protein
MSFITPKYGIILPGHFARDVIFFLSLKYNNILYLLFDACHIGCGYIEFCFVKDHEGGF